LIQKNDFILLIVIFGSMGAGIKLPEFGEIFLPYPLYLNMLLLFFSFLKIDFIAILRDVKKMALILFLLCFIKLIILPVGLFFLTQMIWPRYALPVLLLSGISTGVVAPFISNLLNASTPLVLMMVVMSSLLAPISLPALVSILVGQHVEISFFSMTKTLAMVVFVPAL
jgi:bile acid:Na+ symporter, BASS family